jgi:4'-phosphopantetheinyl transferase EntD
VTCAFALEARTAPAALAARLEVAVRAALDAPIHVAVVADDDAADGVADDHARGRAALARALAAAGRPPEAAPTWPCPHASVSHSHGVAIAVVVDAGAAARGLGVDLELDRPVRPGLGGLF